MNIEAEVLHNRLLSMMKSFHNFCEDNNIRYYMIGGTALGAIRHKGFIPWDDDVDIGVPRPDYEKLLTLESQLPKGLEFLYYKNTSESPVHYVKLVDSNTTLIERFYLNLSLSIYSHKSLLLLLLLSHFSCVRLCATP